MTDAVRTLKEWTDAARKIVFFGGAGVSTESGIPDFRSTGGLYHQEWKYPPETILSHTFYKSNPEEFFRFYRAKMLCPDAKPNACSTTAVNISFTPTTRGALPRQTRPGRAPTAT